MGKTKLTNHQRQIRDNLRNWLYPSSHEEIFRETEGMIVGGRTQFEVDCALELLQERVDDLRQFAAARKLPELEDPPTAAAAWAAKHYNRALARGWTLSDRFDECANAAVMQIQKVDRPEDYEEGQSGEMPAFESDGEALAAVIAQAFQGDQTAALARYLDGRPAHSPVYIPDELKETS